MDHCNSTAPTQLRRGDGIFATLVKALVVYVIVVFAGGTLASSTHPVAAETGRIIRTITFVDPAIRWAETRELTPVATGLRTIANGVPLGAILPPR